MLFGFSYEGTNYKSEVDCNWIYKYLTSVYLWGKYITEPYEGLFFFGLRNDGNLESIYVLTKKNCFKCTK